MWVPGASLRSCRGAHPARPSARASVLTEPRCYLSSARADLSVLLPPHQGEPQRPLSRLSRAVRRHDRRVQGDQARRVRSPTSIPTCWPQLIRMLGFAQTQTAAGGQEATRQAAEGRGAHRQEPRQRPRSPACPGPHPGDDDQDCKRRRTSFSFGAAVGAEGTWVADGPCALCRR